MMDNARLYTMANQNFNHIKAYVGHPAYPLNPSTDNSAKCPTLPLVDCKPASPSLLGRSGLNFDKNDDGSFEYNEV
jgi:hypothetical protein